DAQYARDKARNYWITALDFQTQTQQIGLLSCVQYAANMGPYTKIVPILNSITNSFTEGYETIIDFEPLDGSIPADDTAGQEIASFLNAGTIEIGGAFDRMIQTGTANLCTVPLLGTTIRAALENLKVASRVSLFSNFWSSGRLEKMNRQCADLCFKLPYSHST
ncbi:hypothetical protein B0T21DRAFT_279514, partial [Apiosordaria backusii]